MQLQWSLSSDMEKLSREQVTLTYDLSITKVSLLTTSFSHSSAKFPGIFLLRAQGSSVSWSGMMIATTYDWNKRKKTKQ